jgi:hypothetical protein
MNNLIRDVNSRDAQFSPEQMEILEEEHSQKLANEELKDSDAASRCRKKHCVSERDAFDMAARNEQGY